MSEYCENCRHSELSECGTLYCEKHEESVNDSGYCDDYYRDLKIKDSCNACSIIIGLRQENKQLKEALRKCSPLMWGLDDKDYCFFCGATIDDIDHKDDCEYVRLTKESEGEG